MKSAQIRSYFWSLFSCIWTEYRKIRTKNNSLLGHFSSSGSFRRVGNCAFPQNFHARKFGEIRVFCAVIIYALYSPCHMCLQIYFHDISKNSHKWADFTDFIKKRPMNLLFQKFETLISGIISTKINKHYIKLCREYNTQLIAQKKYECIQRKKRMFRNKLLTL